MPIKFKLHSRAREVWWKEIKKADGSSTPDRAREVFPPDSFIRLNVTFADKQSTPHLALTASPSGDIILEGPAKVGSQYQFEQSEDLVNYTPIDKIYTADTPFVMTFIKPTESNMFYRLREVE